MGSACWKQFWGSNGSRNWIQTIEEEEGENGSKREKSASEEDKGHPITPGARVCCFRLKTEKSCVMSRCPFEG